MASTTSNIGIRSLFSNYFTSTRFDSYITNGDWIIFDTLRCGRGDKIHRVYLQRRDIYYLECGKHLSISQLIISIILIISGFAIFASNPTDGLSILFAGIILLGYVIVAYYSAGLVFHTAIGTLTSGPFVKEDEDIFQWYTNNRNESKSELLEINIE